MGRAVDGLGDRGLLGTELADGTVLTGPGEDADEPPALGRRERPRLLDEDRVADLSRVLLVMRLELRGQADDALVEPVTGEALDGHDDRLVHLVAHDATGLRLADAPLGAGGCC